MEESEGGVESYVSSGVSLCLFSFTFFFNVILGERIRRESRKNKLLMTFEMSRDRGPREGRGNIINVASMYGLVGTPAHISATSYTASKHAVIGLTKADANQYASHAIRINAMCPGYISTPLLLSAVKEGTMDGEIAKTPMARLGMVEEIGDSVCFLASRMASFMTGSVLLVDGGYCAN